MKNSGGERKIANTPRQGVEQTPQIWLAIKLWDHQPIIEPIWAQKSGNAGCGRACRKKPWLEKRTFTGIISDGWNAVKLR